MEVIVIEPEKLAQLITESVDRALKRSAMSFSNIPEPNSGDLLDIEAVAELLNVSVSTIHNYKRQKRIPFLRIGSQVRFSKADVLKSLKKVN